MKSGVSLAADDKGGLDVLLFELQKVALQMCAAIDGLPSVSSCKP